MAAFRGFIAIEISPLPAVEPFLHDLSHIRGLKAVNASSLHVTLKFLGDADEGLAPRIEEVMRASCQGVRPFEIQVIGSGVFPPKGSARVVWAGLKGAEPLGTIAIRLDKGLEDLGFEPEGRAFKPHLTLARVKDPSASAQARQVADRYSTVQFGERKVSELLLKRSVLRPSGPEYSNVLAVDLTG
jgi:2'-5' RNA ligase